MQFNLSYAQGASRPEFKAVGNLKAGLLQDSSTCRTLSRVALFATIFFVGLAVFNELPVLPAIAVCAVVLVGSSILFSCIRGCISINKHRHSPNWRWDSWYPARSSSSGRIPNTDGHHHPSSGSAYPPPNRGSHVGVGRGHAYPSGAPMQPSAPSSGQHTVVGGGHAYPSRGPMQPSAPSSGQHTVVGGGHAYPSRGPVQPSAPSSGQHTVVGGGHAYPSRGPMQPSAPSSGQHTVVGGGHTQPAPYPQNPQPTSYPGLNNRGNTRVGGGH